MSISDILKYVYPLKKLGFLGKRTDSRARAEDNLQHLVTESKRYSGNDRDMLEGYRGQIEKVCSGTILCNKISIAVPDYNSLSKIGVFEFR